jgi:hypothetical protein
MASVIKAFLKNLFIPSSVDTFSFERAVAKENGDDFKLPDDLFVDDSDDEELNINDGSAGEENPKKELPKTYFTPVVDHCFKIKITWTGLKKSFEFIKLDRRVYYEKYEYVIYIQTLTVLYAIRIYSDDKLQTTDVRKTIEYFNDNNSFLEKIGIKEFTIHNLEKLFKVKPVIGDDVEQENFIQETTIFGEYDESNSNKNMKKYNEIAFTRCELVGIKAIECGESKDIVNAGNTVLSLNKLKSCFQNTERKEFSVRFFEVSSRNSAIEEAVNSNSAIEEAVNSNSAIEEAVNSNSAIEEAVNRNSDIEKAGDNDNDSKEAGDDYKASNDNIRVVEAPKSLVFPEVPISNTVKPDEELSPKDKKRIKELEQAIVNNPLKKKLFQKQIDNILSGKSRK